jgi:hypothetical protein
MEWEYSARNALENQNLPHAHPRYNFVKMLLCSYVFLRLKKYEKTFDILIIASNMKRKKMLTVTVSKKKIGGARGMITLPLKEYFELLKNAAPTVYLKGKEAARLDRLVKKAVRDDKNKKTIRISSLRDLM